MVRTAPTKTSKTSTLRPAWKALPRRPVKLVSAEYNSDEDEDAPLSVRAKTIAKKPKKKPYAVVGVYTDRTERDLVFWTKAKYDEYKRKEDADREACWAQMKLPNSGRPADYVVGEKVFYRNACARVVVKRVWINKEAMDKDVQPVFRDASQIASEYHQEVAASEENNRAKHNVKHYNHHAWYEVIWNDLDKMRQIVPQSYLSSNRDPRQPREMVTDDKPSYGLPKPSEWRKFAADYDPSEE